MEQTVYIDGDVLPYKVGFATQRTIYYVEMEGLHSGPILCTKSKMLVNKYLKKHPDLLVSEFFFVEEPIQAIATLKLAIQNIVIGSKCKLFKVVMSGDTNFRTRVATIQEYKANRKGKDKPIHYKMLHDWLLNKPYTILAKDEEADDVISIAMMNGYVGASPDKDLNNTPGLHYNFNRNELYTVTEDEAIKNFYKQMLTGDTADNIPGIRGIGPAKASKLIDHLTNTYDMEVAIHALYSRLYDDPTEAMVEVGQLLWMRREPQEMWYPEFTLIKKAQEEYENQIEYDYREHTGAI